MTAGPQPGKRSRIEILGIPIDTLTVDELHREMAEIVARDEHELVLNVNVNCMNLAYRNPWLHQLLNRARIVFCDGAGVMLAARLLGHHIPERITYADWMWRLAPFAAERGMTLYFVGGRPGVAEQAARRLRERAPALQVVGVDHGYFDKERDSRENRELIRRINAARPDILVTGFGMPLQERWLEQSWRDVDARIALTGGAVFDYVSGRLRRGPRLLTDHGWEWLARLSIEPRRLWRRYLIGNPVFLARVLGHRWGWLRPGQSPMTGKTR